MYKSTYCKCAQWNEENQQGSEGKADQQGCPFGWATLPALSFIGWWVLVFGLCRKWTHTVALVKWRLFYDLRSRTIQKMMLFVLIILLGQYWQRSITNLYLLSAGYRSHRLKCIISLILINAIWGSLLISSFYRWGNGGTREAAWFTQDHKVNMHAKSLDYLPLRRQYLKKLVACQ